MKKTLSIVIFAVIFTIQSIFSLPVVQAAEDFDENYGKSVEYAKIDDVNYRFSIDSSVSYKKIVVEDSLGNVDTIYNDYTEGNIYLNLNKICDSERIGLNPNGDEHDDLITLLGLNKWTRISSSSHYVSWKKGTTVAVVAAAIASLTSGLGPVGVIASIGLSSISALAASAIGGRLYVSLYNMRDNLGKMYYRYEWSFKASTGEYFGPYYYLA